MTSLRSLKRRLAVGAGVGMTLGAMVGGAMQSIGILLGATIGVALGAGIAFTQAAMADRKAKRWYRH